MVSSTISSNDFDAFKAKLEEALSADRKNSAYNQYLNALPNRPHIIEERLDEVQELATPTIPVIVTPNLSNDNPLQRTIVVPKNLQTISAVYQVLPANSTIVLKPEQKDVVISGKRVQMMFPLEIHNEPNPLPISTTIGAMQGYGRYHTTRTYEPYKAYGFKEGDIAITSSTSLTNAIGGRPFWDSYGALHYRFQYV
ncbi:hypothetical protein [Trichormus azollae]|uniref:hypothetical protein n=1 Tax=Trichormus azollae TaxID=1164 RepID=UPI0001956E26